MEDFIIQNIYCFKYKIISQIEKKILKIYGYNKLDTCNNLNDKTIYYIVQDLLPQTEIAHRGKKRNCTFSAYNCL